jgi:hypothetical protein
MAPAVTGWTVCRFHGARGGGTKGERNGMYRQWTSILQSQRLTGALLDRLTHHVHILELSGESFRLKQSRRGGAQVQRALPPGTDAVSWQMVSVHGLRAGADSASQFLEQPKRCP